MELGSSTRKGRFAAIVAALVLCLALPAVAAAKVTVPPGATEGDQYFEEAPNGGGSSSVDKSGGGGAGGSSTGAPVAATPQLDQLGPEGKAAAALANANRPPEQLKAHPIPNPSSQSSSPTDGEGGLGIWFPLLIIGTAFAALAYFLRRRLYPA
jgi:hypothetical protein